MEQPTLKVMRDPLPPFPRLRWILIGCLGPLAFALSLLAPEQLVETYFSRGLYPLLAKIANVLQGWTHLSIAEWLLYSFLIFALIWPLKAWIQHQRPNLKSRLFWRMAGRGCVRAFGTLSLLIFTFYITWAFNYRRQPLAQQLAWTPGPFAVSELESLARDLRSGLDRLAPKVSRDNQQRLLIENPQEIYTQAAWALQAIRPNYKLPVEASPQIKTLLFQTLLNRTLTYGVFSPWTLEAHLNTSIPHSDQPFVAVHELAHFQGIAREDEANFMAWAACSRHPDLRFQYSAYLYAFEEALEQLPKASRPQLTQKLHPGILADFQASQEWAARYRSAVSKASRAAYSGYLKSQGQQDGLKSYGRFLDLMLAERKSKNRTT